MNITQEELKRQHIFNQLNSIKSDAQYESVVLNKLLMDETLIDLEPKAQKAVKTSAGDYRMDLYYPAIRLAIEIDEEKHARSTSEDKKRDKALKEMSGITTYRIRFWGNYKEESIWSKISECRKTIERLRAEIKPEPWIIARHTLHDAKSQHNHLILKKIKKPVFESEAIISNIRLHQSIMQSPLVNQIDIAVYSGATSEIAQVISIAKSELVHIQNGNYLLCGGYHINKSHPLNYSGFTSNSWIQGKQVMYSYDLERIINSDCKADNLM